MLFSYKTASEAVFRVPVTNVPGSGQIVAGTNVDYYWDNVVGIHRNDQKFELQVATDKKFTNVVETKDVETPHARFSNAFPEKGTYYYRIRLKTGTQEFRWTRPVKFYRPGGKPE